MDTYGAMSAQWNSRATVGNSVSSQEVSSGRLNSYQHTSTLDAYASTLAKGTLDMEHLATWARVYAEGYDNGRLPEANALWHRCAAVWNADVPLRTAQAWSLPNKTHAVWTPNPEYTDLINRL